MNEMKRFGNMKIGVQEWNDEVCWINMFGECGFIDAIRAGVYFWELLKKYSDKYDPSGKAYEWIQKITDGLNGDNIEVASLFEMDDEKNLKVTIQSGENDVMGAYTRVGFCL